MVNNQLYPKHYPLMRGNAFLLKSTYCHQRDKYPRRAFHKAVFFLFLLFSLCSFSVFSQQLPVPGIRVNGRVATAGETIQICIGTTLHYEDSSTRASFINWRFKNGSPSTYNNFGQVSVQYKTAGSDTTFQRVIRGSDTAEMFIIIKVGSQKPVASFAFTQADQCGNVPVVFNSSASTGNSLTYAWDFDDGSTSSDVNPNYPFLKAIGSGGTQDYNVRLIVKNNLNCYDTITKLVTVKKIPHDSLGSADPDVKFKPFNNFETFKRCESFPSYNFQFTNESLTKSIITKYTLSFGDGSPDSVFTSWNPGDVVTHPFPIGKTNLKVTVQGSNGCSNVKDYIVFLGTTPAGSLGNLGQTSICADSFLTFPLHDYLPNAAGTTYSFSVNDGSALRLFQHPPPDSITHFFIYGSCGQTSDAYENAFKASLYIENPCGSITSPIVPLYISGKPRANLDIYPSYNVCTNAIVTLSNASNFGGVIDISGSNATCSNTGKQVWQITPSTGYTLVSGDTGSINGNRVSSTTWTKGSSQVEINFNTPGIYAVKIFVGNDRCHIDSFTKTVCVRLPPTASFTLNKHKACAPDSVIITNTSSAPGCEGDTYNWSIQYSDPQNCGALSGYAFIGGTTNASKNPVMRFTEAGRYILKLTVSATGTSNTCPSASFQDTILIKAKPGAAIKPVSAVCIGNDIAPAALVNSCYSDSTVQYRWTFAGGTPATSKQLVPGSVSYSAIGHYLIKFEATNECGVTTDTDSARITSTPAAIAGADQSVCSRTAVQLGSPGSPGISYTWKPAGSLSSASVADPVLNFDYTGQNTDTTMTFVVTAAAGANCFATDTVTIKVKKNPVVSVNPLTANVCQGSGVLLVATGADSYSWTPAGGLNFTTGDSVIASPVNTTQYTVAGTSANGCTAGADATVSVTNYQLVDAGSDTLVCNISSTVQLTGTPAGGTWSGNAFISPAGVFNAGAAGNGRYKTYYTAGTGACTKTDSIFVKVIAPPVANAGLDTSVCQSNTSIQLAGLPSGGRWSNSPLVTDSGSFTPSAPGIYNLIYRIGAGTCTGEDTVAITVVGGITNNTISSSLSICTGNQPSIITGQNATGGNSAPSYQWQSSEDSTLWTNIAGATSPDYSPGILTKTTWYRRVASTVLCSGAEANISLPVKITVNPDATAEFNPTTDKGCVPFFITPAIINLTSFNNSVKEYRWYVNGNYIGSGESFPGYTMSNTGDSITIRLVAVSAFGCVNDTAQHGFTTVETPFPSFTRSDTTGCGPLNISLVNTTPNASRYSYLWNFGQGQSSTSEQPATINFPINPNFGDTLYTVSMTTFSACDTITIQHGVTVRAQPKALFTPDKTEGCSPMEVTFTNTSRGSNGSYIWNFGDGSLPVQTDSAAIAHVFNTGVQDTFYVKLKGSNDCGSDSLVYAIVVKPNAIRIDFAVNGTERFGCAPHTVNFINNTNGANNFVWDFGDGTTLNTANGIDTVMHTYTVAGSFSVKLLAINGCSDTTDTEPVTVELKPAVSFTASPLISCVTDTIHFSNTSDPGISYQWRFGDGSTSVIRDPQKAYNSPGNYHVSLTGSRVFSQGLSCSDSAFADIVIRDTLQGDFTASDTIGSCTPFTVTFKNNNLPSLQTLWLFGDGTTATGESVTHTFTLPGLYNAVMISRSSTGCTYKATHLISVTAPLGSLIYTGGYACTGNNVRFEVQATGTSQYIFMFGNGDSLVTVASVVTYQYPQPGKYVPYAWLAEGSCRIKVSTGDTIKADRVSAGFMLTSQLSCGTTAIGFTDTSYSYFGIKDLQWNFGDGTTSILQNPAKTYTQDAKNYVQLGITGISGCTDTFTLPIDIHVQSFPVSNISSDSVACTGQPIAMTALIVSKDSIADAAWNFGNGTTASGLSGQALYNTPGIYTVRLITTTIYGCADTVYKTVTVKASPVIDGGPDVRICRGQAAQLNAVGATKWQWSPVNRLSCTACSDPVANPQFTTAYEVKGTNALGCSVADTVLVEVVQPFSITVSPDDTICIGSQTQLFASGATNFLWNPASGLSNATASNPIANPTVTTPYRVIASDQYNCFADTGYVTVVVGPYPTVDLGAGTLVVAGTNITMNPVITNGPVKNYAWTPIDNISCTNCPRPVVTVNNNTLYRLEVENIYGCKASDTVSYQVKCEDALQVFIPNAFSPDGDNINDVLMVRGKGLAMVKFFRIFNRWGELVFERNNFSANEAKQGWDGKVRGIPANPDVYVYTAEMICTAGSTFTRKGNVTLFR